EPELTEPGLEMALVDEVLALHFGRLVATPHDPLVPEPALEPLCERRHLLEPVHALGMQDALDMIEQRLLRGGFGVDVLGRATANSLTRPVGPLHHLAIAPAPITSTSNRHVSLSESTWPCMTCPTMTRALPDGKRRASLNVDEGSRRG